MTKTETLIEELEENMHPWDVSKVIQEALRLYTEFEALRATEGYYSIPGAIAAYLLSRLDDIDGAQAGGF